MAQIIGNIQPYYGKGVVRGVGATNPGPLLRGWTQIAAVKNEVVRLSAFQITPSDAQFAFSMQSSVDVSIRYTLSNPTLATATDQYTYAVWTQAETLTAGEIISPNSSLPFTAIEITFSDNGIFSLYSR